MRLRSRVRELVVALGMLGFAAGWPAAATGQAVVGELVEAETGAPISGAFVFLVDDRGDRVAGTMTRGDGRFQLRARRAGHHRLRAERIGYETMESEPLELALDDVLPFRFAIATRPFVLEGIDVAVDARCVVRPQDSQQVARAWDEASKAFRATTVTEDEALYIFIARYFRHDLDPRRLTPTSRDSWERVLVGSVPFHSLDPEVMKDSGFLEPDDAGTLFHGPDAALLLSDPFLDTHCLRLAPASPDEPGALGIAFEPAPGRDVPDIAGVVWLDAATSELRSVDYRYVGLPFPAGRDHTGGRIQFQRLESGAWIIRSWWIRVPEFQTVGRRARVRSFTLEGADIVEVRDRAGVILQTFDPPATR